MFVLSHVCSTARDNGFHECGSSYWFQLERTLYCCTCARPQCGPVSAIKDCSPVPYSLRTLKGLQHMYTTKQEFTPDPTRHFSAVCFHPSERSPRNYLYCTCLCCQFRKEIHEHHSQHNPTYTRFRTFPPGGSRCIEASTLLEAGRFICHRLCNHFLFKTCSPVRKSCGLTYIVHLIVLRSEQLAVTLLYSNKNFCVLQSSVL